MLIRIIIFVFLWSYATLVLADMKFVNRPDVQHFITVMVHKYHFKKPELVAVLNSAKIKKPIFHPFIIMRPVEERPWYLYQMIFITESRIRQGVEFWQKHQATLARAEKVYGVPASIIVATLGVETKYGQNTGSHRVIDALVNKSFNGGRRQDFFRNELIEFLLLTREQHLDPLKIRGSYAGAIGLPQFMPSSYRHFAVDFSGKAHIDLSHNVEDVIGSIANYYKKHGWEAQQPVAIPAEVKGYGYMSLQNQAHVLSADNLMQYGIIPQKTYRDSQKIKLISLKGYYHNEYWVGFHNFDVIKLYNPSNLYAMAVYQLSTYISSLRNRESGTLLLPKLLSHHHKKWNLAKRK